MNDPLNKLRGMDYAALENLLAECNLQITQMTEIANSALYSDAYRCTARSFRDGVIEYREILMRAINEKIVKIN